MRLKLLAALGLLSVTALSPIATQAQVQPASSVETVAKDYVTSGKLSGVVVTIGHGDGPPRVIAEGKIGFGPGAAKADANSLWRVYSMTKPVTGVAAMILIDDGKLKLDQPISDFIPAFKNMRVMDQPNGPGKTTHPARTPITVRHLLTHTAGLGYDLGQPNAAPGSLLELYRTNGINPAQVSAALEPNLRQVRPATLEAFANKLATLPLLAEPGTKWSYSISLDLLGRVIEVASGMPFDAFLQKRIFDPLKMKSTFFTVPKSEVGRYADLPAFFNGMRVPLDPAASSVWLAPPSFPYGGAGLVSSAHDYDRFLHMMANFGELEGARILKTETAKLAMSDLLPAGTDTNQLQGISKLGGKMGFGAGGSVYISDATGRESKGTWGWGGAAGTLGWVDPVRNLRATLMVNYFPAEQYEVRDQVTRAVYAAKP